MPFAASINFRNTATGYVTDGTGQTYSNGDVYPTSRAGLTFGSETGFGNPADRTSSAPYAPEFSGIIYSTASTDFRLDLPAAGTYSVRLALGDAGSPQSDMYCSLHDGATGSLLATVAAGVTTGSGQFFDASGVLRANPGAWRTDNVAVAVSVTGTTPYLVVRLAEAGANVTTLAHLEVAAGGSPALAASTASLVHSGPAGIALAAVAATGGTAPYTYQWQRNAGGGSYSDLANGGGVSGATTLALTDGSATAGTLYGYRLVVTDSSATPATATSNAVTAQVYPGGALSSGGGPLIGPGGLVG